MRRVKHAEERALSGAICILAMSPSEAVSSDQRPLDVVGGLPCAIRYSWIRPTVERFGSSSLRTPLAVHRPACGLDREGSP